MSALPIAPRECELVQQLIIALFLYRRFVHFSDVVIRCQRTGMTDIPGGFSRDKEKLGKQGKVKKRGKTRNLCTSNAIAR